MEIKLNIINLESRKMKNELILALCDADQCVKEESCQILRKIYTVGEISAKL
jgi:hypothetical protein